MGFGIYVATAGAVARQAQIDVVANNIANATSTGYRNVDVSFEEVLSDVQAPNRHMVAVGESRLSTERGPVERTGNPLDVALVGPGFLLAEGRGDAPVLVRSAALRIDSTGRLMDAAGRVMKTDGNVHLDPAKPASITPDGEVIQDEVTLGRLIVVNVPEERALEPIGDGAYLPTEKSGKPFETQAEFVTGAIEGSNVESVRSMVELVQLERDFQSLVRAVQAYKQADERLIETVDRG